MKYISPSTLIFALSIPFIFSCKDACEKRCEVDAAFLEEGECIEGWGITWEELGYEDAGDYYTKCRDEWYEFKGSNTRSDVEGELEWCQGYLRDLAGFEDCNDWAEYWM